MSAPSSGDARSAPEAHPPSAPAPPSWPLRLAPLILLAGLLLSAMLFLRRLPQERQVELRVSDAATVVQLEVTWTEAGEGDAADKPPLHGSSWRFKEGTAPKTLVTTVRLPDGDYRVDIEIDRTSGHDATRRTVTLGEADRIAIPVR